MTPRDERHLNRLTYAALIGVLEAVYEADVTDDDGNTTTVRIRDKVGKGQPSNARFRERAGDPDPQAGPPFNVGAKQEVESDLPPHRWSGQ